MNLINRTRDHPALSLGASPRGSLALFHASQALAALRGRDFVMPDDVKHVAVACLAHRMQMDPESSLGGDTTEQVLLELLKKVEVPVLSEPSELK